MAPRLIELCFQTAGLWEMATLGRMGLPQYVRQVIFLRTPDLAVGGLYAVVTSNPDQGSFDADVLDSAGNRYVQLLGYRTVALPTLVDTQLLKGQQVVAA